jgi:hypothetical protein
VLFRLRGYRQRDAGIGMVIFVFTLRRRAARADKQYKRR